MHLGFHLLHCCVVKASSSRSSTCICNRESRSLESSTSVILHQKRANKVFRNDLHDYSIRFIKLFIMTHFPLCWLCIEPHHIYCELRQSTHGLQEYTATQEVMCVFNSWIMTYILIMLICVGMILLNNLLQYFLFIDVIDLSRICKSNIVLIYNSLVMSYF
jgi:hypothetical protein